MHIQAFLKDMAGDRLTMEIVLAVRNVSKCDVTYTILRANNWKKSSVNYFVISIAWNYYIREILSQGFTERL